MEGGKEQDGHGFTRIEQRIRIKDKTPRWMA